MRLLIITGMSGSGKSSAMNVMEDIGYYCIDNLPPELIPKFVNVCRNSEKGIDKIAVAVDIRLGNMFTEIIKAWQTLKNFEDLEVKILFLEAVDEVLIKRYKETRRKHPLDEKFSGNLHEAIEFERNRLIPLRAVADYYIDSSELAVNQLKDEVKKLFLEKISDSLTIKIMSFGFKYGVSTESDLMFDVRCLLNPFYVKGLREKTGNDEEIVDFVFSQQEAQKLLEKYIDVIDIVFNSVVNELDLPCKDLEVNVYFVNSSKIKGSCTAVILRLSVSSYI